MTDPDKESFYDQFKDKINKYTGTDYQIGGVPYVAIIAGGILGAGLGYMSNPNYMNDSKAMMTFAGGGSAVGGMAGYLYVNSDAKPDVVS